MKASLAQIFLSPCAKQQKTQKEKRENMIQLVSKLADIYHKKKHLLFMKTEVKVPNVF